MRIVGVVLLALAVAVLGCTDDGWRCVRGHDDVLWLPMDVGGVTILQPHFLWSCDEWRCEPHFPCSGSGEVAA